MNSIEKNNNSSIENFPIEIRQAKQSGYSQVVAGQFLSSKYHPKQEAIRLIDAAIKNATNKNHSLNTSPICLLGLFPLDLIPLLLTHTSTPFLFEANGISQKNYSQALSTLFEKKLAHFDQAAKNILGDQKLDEDNIKKISEGISNQIKGEEALKIFLKNLNKEELEQLLVIKSSYAQKKKSEAAIEIILAEKMKRSAEKQTTKKFEWVWQWNKVANHRLLKKASSENIPSKNISFENAPYGDVSSKDTLLEDTSSKNSPPKNIPSKNTSFENAPFEDSEDKNLFWVDRFPARASDDWHTQDTQDHLDDASVLKNEEVKNFLRQTAAKQTAIFIAAGPSVDQHLNDLCVLSHFFPVYAVPGAVKLLLKNKIKIKSVIATDPSYYQNIHFEKAISSIREHRKKIPLIAPLSCHAMSVRQYATQAGNVYFYLDDWQDCQNLIEIIGKQSATVSKSTPATELDLKEVANYISSIYITHDASVSLSALHLLDKLNYRQLVLAGCDFASDGFSIHCKGYSLEENYFTKTNRLEPFENFLQKSHPHLRPKKKGLLSCESWTLYAKHFDQLSKNFEEKGLTVRNFSQFIEEEKKIINLLKKADLDEKKAPLFDDIKYNLNSKDYKKDSFSYKDLSKYIVMFFSKAFRKTLEANLNQTDVWKVDALNTLEKKVKRYIGKET